MMNAVAQLYVVCSAGVVGGFHGKRNTCLGKLVGRAGGGGELNSVCSGSESYQGSLHCIICSRARNSNITIPSLENLQGEIVILLSSLALNCSPSGTHLLWCHSE